jgi:hypothetical protein
MNQMQNYFTIPSYNSEEDESYEQTLQSMSIAISKFKNNIESHFTNIHYILYDPAGDDFYTNKSLSSLKF